MSAETASTPTATPDELRAITIFADLSDEQLRALAALGDVVEGEDGEVLFREGDEALWMTAIIAGEIRTRRDRGNSGNYLIARGSVSGLLPFSRMTHLGVTGCAVGHVRVFRVHKDRFHDMLAAIPELTDRLVGVMSDRIREFTALDREQDKLAALGRLSAGLAHELNNPAAAVLRSSEALRTAFRELRGVGRSLMEASGGAFQELALENELLGPGATAVPIDALARIECEEEMSSWLEEHGIENAWELAPSLVEAGVSPEALEKVADVRGFAMLVRRLALHQQAERLLDEIELGARRIADLVGAVKQYSFMDQASIGEVDVNAGIENTLRVLAHKIGIKRACVKTDFDQELPRLTAYGAELNQVWTNLIENALDAITTEGNVHVRTEHHASFVEVEVSDDGVGIADSDLQHIFEPFFTTKPVGQGSGLGLDAVARVVRRHGGDIRVTSSPGDTRFYVTLPLSARGD